MKPITYDGSDNNLLVQYYRVREGTNYFLVYYKQSSVLRRDPKDAWRVLGVAKFTDNGKALKEWCLEMDSQYNSDVLPDQGRPDSSFASEAVSEAIADREAIKEEEPNDNTKMVV